MKRAFLLSLVAMSILGISGLFVSCSPAQRFYQVHSSIPEKPWSGTSGRWGGYNEERLQGGGYKVQFTGYNEPDVKACAYFATVRAAELAVLSGHMTFYSAGAETSIVLEESNFPTRVIPGYWHEVPFTDLVSNGRGGVIEVTRYRSVWVPDEVIPAHVAVNQINRATMRVSFKGGGKSYDARKWIKGALTNQRKLGRVTIDPKVIEILAE